MFLIRVNRLLQLAAAQPKSTQASTKVGWQRIKKPTSVSLQVYYTSRSP